MYHKIALHQSVILYLNITQMIGFFFCDIDNTTLFTTDNENSFLEK